MDSPTLQASKRDLVFISYAYEDAVFAKWLARKLAAFGYGVWIDQIKILGGESWVDEVEVAIAEKSVRFLAILSKSSINKPNPRKERTKALAVGKKLEISDFILTLNLDGTEPDWTISDISYISFQESWANGLRRVLKKLQSINAPKILANKSGFVAQSMKAKEDILKAAPEPLLTNWLPFPKLPETLKIYEASRLSKEQINAWPAFTFDSGHVAAFFPSSGDIQTKVIETREVYHWPSVEQIRGHETQQIITRIINRGIDLMLSASGVKFGPETKLHYIPEQFLGERLIRYTDTDGQRRHIKTFGMRTIYKPIGASEKVIHRPAARVKARRISQTGYVIQIQPTVAIFDQAGKPITGRAVGPRRKKVTLNWFNQTWRRRFLVFSEILRNQSLASGWSEFEIGEPIGMQADCSLREDLLTQSSSEDDDADTEVRVGIEEMEEWS